MDSYAICSRQVIVHSPEKYADLAEPVDQLPGRVLIALDQPGDRRDSVPAG